MADKMSAPLTDEAIIALYWNRDENAIGETHRKYGKYLLSVAKNILSSRQDCEECLDDTYLGAWGAIPPERPRIFKAFLTVILRRNAINRYNYLSAKRRIPSTLTESLDELAAELPDASAQGEDGAKRLAAAINEYLCGIPSRRRYIFMSRYYLAKPIESIARELSLSRSTVDKELSRIRTELREHLEREGYRI